MAWGGGLWRQHFPLENAAPLQLHTPGMCCHSPPHKDFEPFVGGRVQVLPPNIRSYSSSNRRRNNSRFIAAAELESCGMQCAVAGETQTHGLAAMGQLHTNLQRCCITHTLK